jgi:hypothetical protein
LLAAASNAKGFTTPPPVDDDELDCWDVALELVLVVTGGGLLVQADSALPLRIAVVVGLEVEVCSGSRAAKLLRPVEEVVVVEADKYCSALACRKALETTNSPSPLVAPPNDMVVIPSQLPASLVP